MWGTRALLPQCPARRCGMHSQRHSWFSHSRRSTKEAIRQWRDQKAEAAAAAAAAESAAAEQRAAEERARWEAEQRQRRASLQPFLSDKVAWCYATSHTNPLKTAVIQLGTSCNKSTRQARPTGSHLICRQPTQRRRRQQRQLSRSQGRVQRPWSGCGRGRRSASSGSRRRCRRRGGRRRRSGNGNSASSTRSAARVHV